MILELTKENLQYLGFNKTQVNTFYNTIDTNTLQCNDGNIFVSKPENKCFTGIDFYRKTYFFNGRLRFPFACPEILSEYYNLALTEFLAKQKKLFGMVFNERNQTDTFILQEIKRNEEIIKEHKTYIERYNKRQWTGKEQTINILETYIQYIKNQSQQSETLQQNKTGNTNDTIKGQNLFKVGLLFATGEMNKYFTVNKNNVTSINEGYSAPKIAAELKNEPYNKWILATINNYKPNNSNSNKNIFNSPAIMTMIIEHCKDNGLTIDPYFISRLPTH